VGQTTLDVSGETFRIDASDTGYKGFVGYRVFKFFGAELAYTDLGTFEDTVGGDSFKASGELVALYGMGLLPITPMFDIFGKLGGARWETTSESIIGGIGSEKMDRSGNDVVYGVGLQFSIIKLIAIRAEWEKFKLDDQDLNYVSLGVQIQF
jgi:hypothetical protein